MSSSHHVVEDFICSIPACSRSADLGDILRILQSSRYSTIAVVDEQEYPIGVINGHRLLPLIVKQWSNTSQNSAKVIEGEQRRTASDINDQFDLNTWIEPIVSFQPDISLEQLLSYLNQEVITQSDRQNYIIIDAEGKLRGLLDTFRLSQWLLSARFKLDRFSPQQPVHEIPSLDIPLFKLIEQIPVPLKLETREGIALYENQYWQNQIGAAEISNPLEIKNFAQPIDSNLLSWEFIPSPKEFTPYCLKGNYFLSSSFADSSPQTITFESQKILDTVTQKQIDNPIDLANDLELKSPKIEFNSPPVQEEKAEWQYLRLPLKLTDNQSSSTNSTEQLWLIMAIKLPPTPIEKLNYQQSQQDIEIELVKLNQIKDEFLASISHELKSPLTAIVGLSSLLKEEKLGQLNQRQIRYSELIYRSGKQLMKIVSDMLELTYLATGKLQLNLEPLNIKSLCTEAYQQVLDKLEESNQFENKTSIKPQFKLSLKKDLEILLADKMRLRQILIYLLDNALKSIQWKEATLSTPQKKIKITLDYWSNWIAFTIADNGIGIPEEAQQFLLERCFQSENYLDHHYDEIGLGLILAQQLAKAHGGDISFISCEGRGSKFTLLLPSSLIEISPDIISKSDSIASVRQSLELSYQKDRHQQQSPDYPLAPPNNLLILVINSVVSQINELDLKLKELGYYPIIARTASEALQKARQLKPSKILLNPSSLSQLSGTNVLTLLKSDSLTAKIPVFLLVANRAEQQNYTQADGFLTLPIKQKSLMTIIPSVKQDCSRTKKSLTILHLYPESEITSHLKITQNFDLNLALNEHLSGLNHRVLEADSLEQGELLARIWQIDAIVLDGRILQEPLVYLRSLKKSASLSSLPLVTLDAKTTEAANLIEGLAVFPCLLSGENSNLANLVQVIQIAAGIGNSN